MTRHVILGAGPAAINAIETLREVDGGASSITLVCDEPAYARMVLPYWLAGKIPEGQIYTADEAYYQLLKVDCRIGSRATRIDAKGKTVTLQDGSNIPYDNLLIATGSSAAVPPIPGIDLPGVHPLWTVGHTQAVLDATAHLLQPEVVLVGAGFIGFIVLNALYKRGWKLHVVEMADHVLPRMLDGQSAGLVEGWLKQRGIGLHMGTTVQSIALNGGRKRLTFSNGQTLDADLVIVATGIRPNLDFVRDSGLAIDQGILVDAHMRTNLPGIYAAGDVAQGPDLYGDRPAVHAIQPTAVDHGRIAGANMAGQNIAYPGSLLMNILDVCGLQCASFGRWNEAGVETMDMVNPTRPIGRKLLWTGETITGAVFVGPANDLGMLNDVGMVKGIMQTRTSLGAWKAFLRDNPFDIRRPYVALKVAETLAKTTLLGRPARTRQYRFENRQAGPQVTHAAAHLALVRAKE